MVALIEVLRAPKHAQHSHKRLKKKDSCLLRSSLCAHKTMKRTRNNWLRKRGIMAIKKQQKFFFPLKALNNLENF